MDDKRVQKYSRNGHLQEYIDLIRESVTEDLKMTISRLSQTFAFRETMVHRILRKDLALKTKEVKPLVHSKHRTFIDGSNKTANFSQKNKLFR